MRKGIPEQYHSVCLFVECSNLDQFQDELRKIFLHNLHFCNPASNK